MDFGQHATCGEPLTLSRYIRAVPLAARAGMCLYSGRSGRIVRMPEEIWQRLNQPTGTSHAWLPRELLDTLIEAEMLVSAAEDETRTVIDRFFAVAELSNVLYTVICPSGQCNLACGYCGQHRREQSIKQHVCDAILAVQQRQWDTGRYVGQKICWFGGEPLLGLEVMRHLTQRMLAECKRRGMAYSAKIVTNGVLLTPEVARELVLDLWLREIEVTLDGAEQHHDIRRITHAGHGTYRVIIENLKALAGLRRSRRFDINVRCNLDAENTGAGYELMDALEAEGLLDQVTLKFGAVHPWGQASKPQDSMSQQAMSAIDRELISYARSKGVITEAWVPGRKTQVCMHTRPTSFALTPDGLMASCTEVLFVDGYEPERWGSLWHTGNVVEVAQSDVTPVRPLSWLEQLREGVWPCTTCTLLGVCGGNCPRHWHEGRRPCPSWTYDIEERIRLAAEDDARAEQQGMEHYASIA